MRKIWDNVGAWYICWLKKIKDPKWVRGVFFRPVITKEGEGIFIFQVFGYSVCVVRSNANVTGHRVFLSKRDLKVKTYAFLTQNW